jgi:hypothetical protein
MDHDKHGRATGNANLGMSAAYPLALGEDLADAWETTSKPVPTIMRVAAPSQHPSPALAAGSGSGIQRFSSDASPWEVVDDHTPAVDGPTPWQPLTADNPWATAASEDHNPGRFGQSYLAGPFDKTGFEETARPSKAKKARSSAMASTPWDSQGDTDSPWAGTDSHSATSVDDGMSPWS